MLPIIPIAAGLVSQGINAATTDNANTKNRDFQREMYERQKSDNLANWNLSNEYNSPQAQMQRLQAAGLNPNLIYGSGGQTGGTASPMAAPDRGSYSHQPIQTDLATPFASFTDTAIKNAQLDNLKAQNTDIVNSAILKGAQTIATLTGSENTKFKTDFLRDTQHITRAFMAEQANKMHYDQYQSQSAASVADEKNQLSISSLKQNLDNMKQTGQTIKLRNALMEIEQDMRKQGIQPNDPIYMRMISRLLADQGVNINQLLK